MATASQRFYPGPPGPLTALRTGGKHGVYLAADQQAGSPAPAALPGLAHCDHRHHLPPVEGQLVSSIRAFAIRGERLRHRSAEGRRMQEAGVAVALGTLDVTALLDLPVALSPETSEM